MKTRMTIISALALGVLSLQTAQAQQLDIQRIDVAKSNISVPGKEAIQTRVDLNPGALATNHKHPDEEIAVVLQGTLEYRIEGRKPVTLKADQSLFIPSGVPHTAKNVGDGKASELATYVVSKGVALVEPVK
ncbi:cupin domain-containing protein [Rhizobium sp. BK068]|uniref:cupin domain-containing protein n=1 Tax=Rhizobium sp. BK068 TaxID=2512130 RepID=UPI00104EDC49|nr:cupin domain-containing protein [Rhizobium sp. BK068]TCM64428.1 quercetin dioxygenase-like cupin family protein [Rhizobium sp. BK068]